MASAKRFLVSPSDYDKLVPHGRLEHLIEFQLTDDSIAGGVIDSYLQAGMPSNGPPGITRALLRMMNALSDGVMITVLLLISILIVLVVFLCVRFTLLAKIEEDYREIGVLKAIGLKLKDIQKLYLAKYGIMSAVACVLGFLLSLPLQQIFTENIRAYFGESNNTFSGLLIGMLGAVLIFLVVILYVRGVLNRFKKISASEAIRYGAPTEKSKGARGFRLSGSTLFTTNAFLGLKDVLSRKKLYITMLLVLINI